MLRKIQELRILKAIVGLSKNPETTDNVFFIADTMLDMLTHAEAAQHTETIMAYPLFRQLFEEKYAPSVYDVEVLSTYVEGTLAHAYGVFMHKHGYVSDWYPVREGSEPLTYMRNRLYQTHDLIHTMTGFDGSQFGEIGVQAFYLGQMPEQPLPCAIMSSGFLRALNLSAWDRDRLMHVLYEGYEMGRKAHPVLFRKWENDWRTNIHELRDTLRIGATNSSNPSWRDLAHSPKPARTATNR